MSGNLEPFTIYWREHPRTSIARVSTFEATRETVKPALRDLGKQIKAQYPDAVFLHATLSRSARFPVKDFEGNLVAPSRI